jgi:hypothetical protein
MCSIGGVEILTFPDEIVLTVLGWNLERGYAAMGLNGGWSLDD